MTWTITDELEALRAQIESSSDLITRCTLDKAGVQPPSGQVHAWLQPPSLAWDQWSDWDSEYELVLIAGTTETQEKGALLMLKAITELMDSGVNLVSAEPAGWKLADTTQIVAAYDIKVRVNGPIEKTGEEHG